MVNQRSIPYGSLRISVPIFKQYWKILLGKESIEKRASLLRSFGIILQNEKCIYLYLKLEGTFIYMQPYVVQEAGKYLLASKLAPIAGYTQLPPPPKTTE